MFSATATATATATAEYKYKYFIETCILLNLPKNVFSETSKTKIIYTTKPCSFEKCPEIDSFGIYEN